MCYKEDWLPWSRPYSENTSDAFLYIGSKFMESHFPCASLLLSLPRQHTRTHARTYSLTHVLPHPWWSWGKVWKYLNNVMNQDNEFCKGTLNIQPREPVRYKLKPHHQGKQKWNEKILKPATTRRFGDRTRRLTLRTLQATCRATCLTLLFIFKETSNRGARSNGSRRRHLAA